MGSMLRGISCAVQPTRSIAAEAAAGKGSTGGQPFTPPFRPLA
jgi:hypothetical protein